jgi:hypothetical protein
MGIGYILWLILIALSAWCKATIGSLSCNLIQARLTWAAIPRTRYLCCSSVSHDTQFGPFDF